MRGWETLAPATSPRAFLGRSGFRRGDAKKKSPCAAGAAGGYIFSADVQTYHVWTVLCGLCWILANHACGGATRNRGGGDNLRRQSSKALSRLSVTHVQTPIGYYLPSLCFLASRPFCSHACYAAWKQAGAQEAIQGGTRGHSGFTVGNMGMYWLFRNDHPSRSHVSLNTARTLSSKRQMLSS